MKRRDGARRERIAGRECEAAVGLEHIAQIGENIAIPCAAVDDSGYCDKFVRSSSIARRAARDEMNSSSSRRKSTERSCW